MVTKNDEKKLNKEVNNKINHEETKIVNHMEKKYHHDLKEFSKSNIRSYLLKMVRHHHEDAAVEQLMNHAEWEHKLHKGVEKRVSKIINKKTKERLQQYKKE